MKRFLPLALVVTFCLVLAVSCEAGGYSKQNHTIFLDGKVKVRFDQIVIGWTRSHQILDRIHYKMTCLAGKAVLVKVEYLDKAEGKEAARWADTPAQGLDFSAITHHMDKQHRVSISKTLHPQVTPFDMDSAKVCFHIDAAGRHYKVFWLPKKGDVYAIW